MASKPMQRSLAMMRAEGYVCGITEKYNSFIKIRQDLYGFADFIALHATNKRKRVLVQTTDMSNMSAHRKKFKKRKMKKMLNILRLHFRLELHGWRKLKRSNRWECQREVL